MVIRKSFRLACSPDNFCEMFLSLCLGIWHLKMAGILGDLRFPGNKAQKVLENNLGEHSGQNSGRKFEINNQGLFVLAPSNRSEIYLVLFVQFCWFCGSFLALDENLSATACRKFGWKLSHHAMLESACFKAPRQRDNFWPFSRPCLARKDLVMWWMRLVNPCGWA